MKHMKKALALLAIIGMVGVGTQQWAEIENRSARIILENNDAAPEQKPQVEAVIAEVVSEAASDGGEWALHHVARENADDVESVMRLFRGAGDCLLYHSARHEINVIRNDERLDDLSNDTLATLENLDARFSKYRSIVRQTEPFCKGSDQEALALVYIDSILKAALLGNPDAESCFVISRHLAPSRAISRSPEWMAFLMDRYLKYAPAFTNNALERGDPYVAANALHRYIATPIFHPTKLDGMEKADPYLTWRGARLASYRALPEQRLRLEYGLAELEKLNIISTDDIERADAWARAAYEREYADQLPINLDSQVPCYSSPDLAP